MTEHVHAIDISAGPATLFPALSDDQPVVQIILTGDGPDGDIALRTNLGADLVPDQLARVVGLLLHDLGHCMLNGFAVDMADLDRPVDETCGGDRG